MGKVLAKIFGLTIFFSAVTTNAYQDGTLLIIKHGHRIVQRRTDSPFTHVAVILRDRDGLNVYESTYPEGVRRVPINTYVEMISAEQQRKGRPQLYIMRPKRTITKQQTELMRRYAHSQLGRRYSARSFLTGRTTDGIHCSEFIGNVLSVGGIIAKCNTTLLAPKDIINLLSDWYEEMALVMNPIPTTSSSYRKPRSQSSYERRLPPDSFCDELPIELPFAASPPSLALDRSPQQLVCGLRTSGQPSSIFRTPPLSCGTD
jgi:hypothetical protein